MRVLFPFFPPQIHAIQIFCCRFLYLSLCSSILPIIIIIIIIIIFPSPPFWSHHLLACHILHTYTYVVRPSQNACPLNSSSCHPSIPSPINCSKFLFLSLRFSPGNFATTTLSWTDYKTFFFGHCWFGGPFRPMSLSSSFHSNTFSAIPPCYAQSQVHFSRLWMTGQAVSKPPKTGSSTFFFL